MIVMIDSCVSHVIVMWDHVIVVWDHVSHVRSCDSCVRSCDMRVMWQSCNMRVMWQSTWTNLLYLKWECMYNYKLQFSIWTNSHSHPMLPGYIWQLVARQQLLIIHSQKQKMALWRLEVEKDGFTRHINHEARMKISLWAHTCSLA